MAEDWQVFGHPAVKQMLARSIAQRTFAHAYLFLGPEGVGKKTLAKEFAEKILATEHAESHPDFLLLESFGELKIETVREFIRRLFVKPFVGPYKVAVIHNAENLNTESANALLKTLEEPSASTVIILVSKNRDLPATILSRCQPVHFNRFTDQELRDFAKAKGLAPDEELLELSAGLPARLVELMANPEMKKKLQQDVRAYGDIWKSGVAERIAAIKRYADLETDELHGLFMEWLAFERNRLRKDLAAARGLRALLGALHDLTTNKNKQLILQALFLKI